MSTLVSGRPARGDHDVPIVEPDDRYALGYVDRPFPQRVGSAARDLVVAAKQRVGWLDLAIE